MGNNVVWSGALVAISTMALMAMLLALACGPASPSGQQTRARLSADSSDDEVWTAVADYAESKTFDAAVRATVGQITEISVPIDQIDWSPYRKPEFKTVRRHSIDVVEVYDGDVPDSFVIKSDERLVNKSLKQGQEYILFVNKAYARNPLNKSGAMWHSTAG